ncbi:sulfatase-like hydrolase/transferase [Agaribacter marinus]|uniref:N-acetylgalactosamine-6-sulfatase n=1 Tax=Agaribacter marinus TaxID=1431249 RepID=A0AA37SWD3_9ALTE|nr:sulfatase-like hydrolase/transferase [Agaribacter marinus]GLR69824.1 N-acetylgalactosamine-6-sulfatase [Agaribacter marinus]
MKFFTIYSLIFVLCHIAIDVNAKVEGANHDTQTKAPNIVILLADDMGYGELSSYGQTQIKTPNIDKLAKNGIKFTDFYAGTSVCAPSRAVLMTGRHTGNLSIRGNKGYTPDGKWGRIPLKKSETTIAEMLQNAGYQTAMVGKWHLDIPEDESTWAHNRGFDYAVQEQWGKSANGMIYDEREHWLFNNGKKSSAFYDYNEYSCLDEFRTDYAIDFLNKKSDDKPFFLYMSYRSPHAHEFFLRKNDLYKEHAKEWPEIERRHAARITMLDEQIQRLLDKLEADGELDNTFILFTSDNGPHAENHHDRHFFDSSGGLKGYKRDVYEGGVRIPAIAYWQGKIEAGETKHMAAFYDIMPTLADLASTNAPINDGISFAPLLFKEAQDKHQFIYWEIQEGESVNGFRQAVRLGKWKAIRYADKLKTELYDLSRDLSEKKDLANKHPELVAQANNIMKKESKVTPRFPFSGGVWQH